MTLNSQESHGRYQRVRRLRRRSLIPVVVGLVILAISALGANHVVDVSPLVYGALYYVGAMVLLFGLSCVYGVFLYGRRVRHDSRRQNDG